LCGDGSCDANSEDYQSCPSDCPAPSSYCGDGFCDLVSENLTDCPQDCTNTICGNGTCDTQHGENSANCPNDCAELAAYVCGDGVCELDLKESRENCPQDCLDYCGDGRCDFSSFFVNEPENRTNCPRDCVPECGNGYCQVDIGEMHANCPQDCLCGDGTCQSSEDRNSCSIDCIFCGDNICEMNGGETYQSCPADCFCGDRVCDPKKGENITNCLADCNTCGDLICYLDGGENYGNCPRDCAPTCGNQICDRQYESISSCPQDCPAIGITCGDGTCDPGEGGQMCCADCCGDGLCDWEERCTTDCGRGLLGEILGPLFDAGQDTCERRWAEQQQKKGGPRLCQSPALLIVMAGLCGFAQIRKRKPEKIRGTN